MTQPTSILIAQVLTEGDDQVVLLPESVWFTGSSVNTCREDNEVLLAEKLSVPAGCRSGPLPIEAGGAEA